MRFLDLLVKQKWWWWWLKVKERFESLLGSSPASFLITSQRDVEKRRLGLKDKI